MNSTAARAAELIGDIQRLWELVSEKEKALGNIRKECERIGHKWGEIDYIPEHHERKWKRMCTNCLLEQETTRTRQVEGMSNDGLSSNREVPDFGAYFNTF